MMLGSNSLRVYTPLWSLYFKNARYIYLVAAFVTVYNTLTIEIVYLYLV